MLWSEPELLLYDRERERGHGYPDVITDEATGRVYVTEAYKYVPYAEAKTHAVAPALIAALLAQPTVATAAAGWAAAFDGGGAFPVALPNWAQYRHARFRATLEECDFSEFPPLDARKLEKLEDALKRRIPDLMRTPDYATDALTHRAEEEGGYQRWW